MFTPFPRNCTYYEWSCRFRDVPFHTHTFCELHLRENITIVSQIIYYISLESFDFNTFIIIYSFTLIVLFTERNIQKVKKSGTLSYISYPRNCPVIKIHIPVVYLRVFLNVLMLCYLEPSCNLMHWLSQ